MTVHFAKRSWAYKKYYGALLYDRRLIVRWISSGSLDRKDGLKGKVDRQNPKPQKQPIINFNGPNGPATSSSISQLISKLFGSHFQKPKFTDTLKPFEEPEPTNEQSPVPIRPDATKVLRWVPLNLSFDKSDFERILPPKEMRLGKYGPELDNVDFQVIRSRDPSNLVKSFGYFLVFPTKEAANMYYHETRGAELCGIEVKFTFADVDPKRIHRPILEKTPDIPPENCALLIGAPDSLTQWNILKAMWDFDFVDDDSLAVESLPKGRVRYGHVYLLRFKSASEARRAVSKFNGRKFPNTSQKIFLEIVD